MYEVDTAYCKCGTELRCPDCDDIDFPNSLDEWDEERVRPGGCLFCGEYVQDLNTHGCWLPRTFEVVNYVPAN